MKTDLVEDSKIEIDDVNVIESEKIPYEDLRILFQSLSDVFGLGNEIFQDIKTNGEYVVKIPKDLEKEIGKTYEFCKKGSQIIGELRYKKGNSEGKSGYASKLPIEKRNNYSDIQKSIRDYQERKQIAEIAAELKEAHKQIIAIKEMKENAIFCAIEATYDQLKNLQGYSDEEKGIINSSIANAQTSLLSSSKEVYLLMVKEITHFDKVPSKKSDITLKLLIDSKYKVKKDREADNIIKLFNYYRMSMKLLAYSYYITKNTIAKNNTIEDFGKRIEEIDTTNLKTIKNLHENMDVNKIWFNDQKSQKDLLKFEVDKLKLYLDEDVYIKIQGDRLLEVL